MKLRFGLIGLIFVLLFLIPNCTGSFDSKSDYSVDNGPENVSAVDFDSDGDNDLVFICNGDIMTDASSIIHLVNDGTGKFSAQSENVDTIPMALYYEDMDNDGDLDKIFYDNESLKLYTNDGSGSFSLSWEYEDSSFFTPSIEILDVNGDNRKDISFFDTFDLMLFISDGSGGYDESSVDIAISSNIYWFDLDSDGDKDIFNTFSGMKLFGELTEDPIIEVLLNDGQGGFESLYEEEPTHMIGEGALGKFGSDIIVFLADLETNWIYIYKWKDSELTLQDTIKEDREDDDINQMEVSDMNGDGKLEFLILKESGYTSAIIRIYTNVLDSTRTSEDLATTSETTEFCIFDADGDSLLDIAGWEGSSMMMAGDTVWVSLQGASDTPGNGNGGNGEGGIPGSESGGTEVIEGMSFLLISLIFIIFVVVLLLVIIIILIQKKKGSDPTRFTPVPPPPPPPPPRDDSYSYLPKHPPPPPPPPSY